MLISKRSRRKSELFESRFRDGSGGNFPLRQYLRCREDFTAGLVHAGITIAFAVTLVIFGRTLGHLFDSQGAHLNPWFKRIALISMGFFVLSVLRRLYYKVMELRESRQEMAHLQAEFRNPDGDAQED